MNKLIFTLIFTCLEYKTAQASCRVEVTVEMCDLSGDADPLWPCRAPDAYYHFYYRPNGLSDWKWQGTTESVSDNCNPAWSNMYAFHCDKNCSDNEGSIKVEGLDADVDQDDFMGEACVSLQDLCNNVIVDEPITGGYEMNGYVRMHGMCKNFP